MKKILTVLGARPQFIKAAVVSRLIQKEYSNKLEEILVHTGQHYDQNMSDVFFQEMSIPTPKYLLKMGNKSHGNMTGSMIIELEKIMLYEKPDIVLVYGDTNSTMAASIGAAKLCIPIAHIEAGMRSGNKNMPEEINRTICDHLSTYLFCTTKEPLDNLNKENILDNVYIVGDVMYDAVLYYKNRSKPSDQIKEKLDHFYLATCHRQENTSNKERLKGIFSALREISSKNTKILLPLHPRTKKYIQEYEISTDGIMVTKPMSYLETIFYLQRSTMVITDSGGLQREAYYLEKPILLINDQTEWKELVEKKISVIAGANYDRILQCHHDLLGKTIKDPNIYGDGNAAKKILDILSA
jgi:UDP-GlcNAc3NAcA epimerase